jgi:catechol 2,3-dioxygenase-like lactoylglutathione lyase family enzyme
MTPINRSALCLVAAALSVVAGAPKRPRLSGIAHMALQVSDVEKARAFYRDFLGYRESQVVKNPDGSPGTISFRVNDTQTIEVSPGLRPEMDRLDHIALRTDDVQTMRAYLAARGIRATEAIHEPKAPKTSFEVKDADEHTVEFVSSESNAGRDRDADASAPDSRISTRILHLGILVGDVEAAMKFYGGALGFTEFWRGAARDSKTASWINVRLPESEDYLEFMLYAELPAGDHRGTQHHICLEVPDIEKAMAKLEANPYRQSYTRPLEIRTGINRRRQLNLFDPDGTRIELMEPRTVDGVPPASTTLPLPRR